MDIKNELNFDSAPFDLLFPVVYNMTNLLHNAIVWVVVIYTPQLYLAGLDEKKGTNMFWYKIMSDTWIIHEINYLGDMSLFEICIVDILHLPFYQHQNFRGPLY